jgi:fumarate reductase flavoprotein subunit/urocanate reductase
VGAKVQKPDGTFMNVKANKGVVLAGGSWKANVELRKLTDPRFTENMIATGSPFVEPDGSAILAGLRAGALMVGDRCEDTPHLRRKFGTMHYGFPKGSQYGAPGLGIKGARWADVIFTNKAGDRFVREEDVPNLGGFSFYDVALAQPEQFLWTIFDDATAKKYKWSTQAPTCEEGMAFDADTLEELAKKTNQPNLVETVNKYNKFVDQKKDDDFGKPEALLTKRIEQGPFHAVRLVLCVHNLTGGLAINENAQVLGYDAKPIPGLYAAGETAGGLYVGNGMPRGIMPGRFAGEHMTAK